MASDTTAVPGDPQRPTLKKRAMKGAAWTTAQFGVASFLRLGSNLVLTRLLAPEAFGLIGIAVMLQFLVEMISDIGIKSSVIRSENAKDPDFISTAWMLQMARSGLVAALVALGAGVVWVSANMGWVPEASIFADPRAPLFILVGAASSLITGTISVKYLLAERNFHMGRIAVFRIIGQVLSTAATIAIAYSTGDPLALTTGLLVAPIYLSIVTHLFFEGPSFSFRIRREYVHEMLSFGAWILLASLFTFFAARGSQFLFGFFLDAREFSFLSIALTLITIVRQGMMTIQRRVALPAFSELRRERPEQQTQAYYKMRLVADGFAIFVFLGTLFVSGPILDVLYPESYDRVIYYVQLMSLTLLFVPFELLDAVLLSEGSSRQYSAVKLAVAIAVVILIPLSFYTLGPEIAIIISAATPAAAIPFTLLYGKRTITLTPWREAVLPSLAVIAFIYLMVR